MVASYTLLSVNEGLHPVFPVGQVGGGEPSALSRNGVERVPNNRIDVARKQNSLFTVHLL
jgi:hypothetical protein